MFRDPEFRFQYTIVYGFVTIIKNIFICTGILVKANASDKSDLINKTIDIDLGLFNPLQKKNNL